MPQDISTRADIEHLVASFYDRALRDETIGYVFTEVARLNLATHLPVICDFWESILLGNMIYRGNPMLKHLELAEKTELTPAHFGAWLRLWEDTVKENFTGEKAELAVHRAKSIGGLMLHKIQLAKDRKA